MIRKSGRFYEKHVPSKEVLQFAPDDLVYYLCKRSDGVVRKREAIVREPLFKKVRISYYLNEVLYIQSVYPDKLEKRGE